MPQIFDTQTTLIKKSIETLIETKAPWLIKAKKISFVMIALGLTLCL